MLLVPAAASASPPPRVTVFGDSVQASFGYSPQATSILGHGLRLQMQAAVCRKLVAAGCFRGNPASVRAVAQQMGSRLGPVVVVHVGYNDWAASYDAPGLMRTFRQAGVRAVVWVLLRERQSSYRQINARIRATARLSGRNGYPLVRLADWDAVSRGHGGWFASDGIHLNGSGAVGLAHVLRPRVLRTLAELGIPVSGATATLPVSAIGGPRRVTALAADRDAVWAQAGERVVRIDARRPAVRVPDGASLVSSGRRAWLLAPSERPTTVRGDRRPDVGAPATAVATVGGRTWFVVPCASPDPAVCPVPALLRRVGGGRITVPVETVPSHVAGARNGLWVARPGADGRDVVELRARDGRVVRAVAMPRSGRVRAMTATSRGLFALGGDGVLRLVTRGGRVLAVRRGVGAVAGDGVREVWAVEARRGRLVRLDPVAGRVLAVAPIGRRSIAPLTPLTLTRNAAWTTRAGGGLVRVPTR